MRTRQEMGQEKMEDGQQTGRQTGEGGILTGKRTGDDSQTEKGGRLKLNRTLGKKSWKLDKKLDRGQKEDTVDRRRWEMEAG